MIFVQKYKEPQAEIK